MNSLMTAMMTAEITPVFGSLMSSAATLVLVPVLVAALTATATLLVTRASEAANRRRDRYAQAVETLVAWIELPYRIRRRTSDDPATLTALANLGHDLQERLACHQAWIATEHPALAETYRTSLTYISSVVGPAAAEAWNATPVTAAADMNLGAWGPAPACRETIEALQRQIQDRFGVRRLRAAWRGRRHHPGGNPERSGGAAARGHRLSSIPTSGAGGG